MNGEVRGMWVQAPAPVHSVRVRWIAAGPLGFEEARAIAFGFAAALGTVIGVWLAGFVS